MDMKKLLITLLVLLILGGIIFGLYYFFWTAENFASLAEDAAAEGKYEKAMDYYETALELDPANSSYALALADYSILAGNYTAAERALANSIREAPTTELVCKLSGVYVAQDKLLDARELLDGITDAAILRDLETMRPAAPVFTPASGEYDQYIAVSFEAFEGTLYYSTNYEYPGPTTGTYSEPIPLSSGSSSFTAVIVSEDGLVSPLAEAEYLVMGVVEELQFASPELEAYIRDTLYVPRTSPVMSDLLWGIAEFTVPEDVMDYSDLRYFPDLTSLTIHDGTAEDYSFLTALPGLTKLDLNGCLVSSETLGYISQLSELTELHLSGCGISSVDVLGSNTKLQKLDLSGNSVYDISVLVTCPELTHLNLNGNAVSSLDCLRGNSTLVSLDISQNNVAYLAPLSECSKLEEIYANGNRISDVSVLAGMPGLKILCANQNDITDVSALASCTQLTRLELADNELTAIDVLAVLKELTYLDISHNQIAALPVLDLECHLQQFYASYNLIEDVSMLAGLPELTYVNVDYNENLEEIECLNACHLLVQVDAFGTKVAEVKLLTDMGVIVNFTPIVNEEDD